MTKKERARHSLLALALFAHSEAARERGTDAAAYAEHVVRDFSLGSDELNRLTILAQLGRGESFTRTTPDGKPTSPRELLLDITVDDVATMRYPQTWAMSDEAEKAKTREELGKVLSIVRALAGVA